MSGGAPKGNKNHYKDRLLQSAFRRELTQNPEDALLIARAAIDKAKGGDMQAAVFVRDTCDGKPDRKIDIGSDARDVLASVMSHDELCAAVLGRMAPFLRPALRSLVSNGEAGPGSDSAVN